ncbi:MAG: hypothetical protein ABR594_18740 [Pyrinomonadaceae bacterium]
MTDKYEAAEVLVIGRAQDVILGIKDEPIVDNRTSSDPFNRDTPSACFDE